MGTTNDNEAGDSVMLHVVDIILATVIILQAVQIRYLTKRLDRFENVHMKNIVDMIMRLR